MSKQMNPPSPRKKFKHLYPLIFLQEVVFQTAPAPIRPALPHLQEHFRRPIPGAASLSRGNLPKIHQESLRQRAQAPLHLLQEKYPLPSKTTQQKTTHVTDTTVALAVERVWLIGLPGPFPTTPTSVIRSCRTPRRRGSPPSLPLALIAEQDNALASQRHASGLSRQRMRFTRPPSSV